MPSELQPVPEPSEDRAAFGCAGPPAAAARAAPGVTLSPARVAWVDYQGELHVGNLATRAKHVVATVHASAADPMIQVGGMLYWADDSGKVAPIRDYDIATGKIGYLPPGNSVFASGDRRHIYTAQGRRRLIELPAGGIGAARRLALPAGWHLSGGLGNCSVGSGIIVYSGPADQRLGPTAMAAWNPRTGQVQVIGNGMDVTDTYTPPGAGYSLLAWTGGRRPCCRLAITNTSTLATITVRSPARYGFTNSGLFSSGAFSPDGTRLAAMLNTTNPQDPYTRRTRCHRQHQNRDCPAGSRRPPGDDRRRGLGLVAAGR